MTYLILLSALALLLALIFWAKLDAFVALLMAAVYTGLVSGMAPDALLKSLQNGIGSTIGPLAPVIGLGVMLGSLLSFTGATQSIANRLLQFFGEKRAGLALAVTGFTVGIVLFYNVGFVVLAPLVFSLAKTARLPLAPLAISMAAPLSVTHGFLPPHPGATAVANVFGANIGLTMLLGLILALPTVLAAGWLFPKTLKNIVTRPPDGFTAIEPVPSEALPGFAKSALLSLLPVILMAAAALAEFTLPKESTLRSCAQFLGDATISLLLTVLVVLLDAGMVQLRQQNSSSPIRLDVSRTTLQKKLGPAMAPAGLLLLVLGMGGAFKNVITDTGIGKQIVESVSDLPLSPLLLGWLIATMLRIAIGSATVAGITAAGIIQPMMVATPGISPELMTLSIGAGSLMCSHVNDTGFWMFKEWFGLSLKDTFKTWTVMETIVGVFGLIGVLLLDIFI